MSLREPKVVTAMKRVRVTVPPAIYPVTVAEVTEHLRLPTPLSTEEQADIESMIAAATDEVETYLRKALITRTLVQTMDSFFSSGGIPIFEGAMEISQSAFTQGAIKLRQPPLQEVVEVRVYDIDNNASVYSASNYYADVSTPNDYGRIVLNYQANAPTNLRQTNAVEYEFKAGYGASAEAIPPIIIRGILQLIGYLYENRGDCTGNTTDDVDGPLNASGAMGLLRRQRIERLIN